MSCVEFELKLEQQDTSTPPKFNLSSEKWCLEEDPFLLSFGLFSGTSCQNFKGVHPRNLT